MNRDLELYKLLVSMNILADTEKKKEFAFRLALSMSNDSCLIIDREDYNLVRNIGKTKFFCMLSKMLNKEGNKTVIITQTRQEAVDIKRRDKSLCIETVDRLEHILRFEKYTHIIFDSVDAKAYDIIPKYTDRNKDVHMFGTLIIDFKEGEK